MFNNIVLFKNGRIVTILLRCYPINMDALIINLIKPNSFVSANKRERKHINWFLIFFNINLILYFICADIIDE